MRWMRIAVVHLGIFRCYKTGLHPLELCQESHFECPYLQHCLINRQGRYRERRRLGPNRLHSVIKIKTEHCIKT
jgi:hypothetical protein